MQMQDSIGKQLDETVAKLVQAEGSSNVEAVQEIYEELFAICYNNHLDLTALLATEFSVVTEAISAVR